jgi:transcriptional regulator with XRE-family HTH domain
MIDEKVIEGLREYLKDHYILPHGLANSSFADSLSSILRICGNIAGRIAPPFRNISDEATEYIKKNHKPGGFSHALERKRKEIGLVPAELYKRANVDRRQYSKYMKQKKKHPSMATVIKFALALRLPMLEFVEFLQTAGYSLSNASSRDVCVMYCLEKSIYEIEEVNALLFAIGIEPLSRE